MLASRSPVAGLCVSKVFPDTLSTHLLLIRILVCLIGVCELWGSVRTVAMVLLSGSEHYMVGIVTQLSYSKATGSYTLTLETSTRFHFLPTRTTSRRGSAESSRSLQISLLISTAPDFTLRVVSLLLSAKPMAAISLSTRIPFSLSAAEGSNTVSV